MGDFISIPFARLTIHLGSKYTDYLNSICLSLTFRFTNCQVTFKSKMKNPFMLTAFYLKIGA